MNTDINYCERCSSEYKKTLGFFNLDRRKCLVCEKNICSNCSIKEERYYRQENRRGHPCIDCYSKTRSINNVSLLPNPNNFKSMSEIPVQLNEVSIKLERLGNILEKQTKEATDFTNDFFNENLEVVKKELNVRMKEIVNIIEDQTVKIQKTAKETVHEILINNWSMIKRDIYKIILFIFLGVFFICGLITLEVLMIIRLFS